MVGYENGLKVLSLPKQENILRSHTQLRKSVLPASKAALLGWNQENIISVEKN